MGTIKNKERKKSYANQRQREGLSIMKCVKLTATKPNQFSIMKENDLLKFICPRFI